MSMLVSYPFYNYIIPLKHKNARLQILFHAIVLDNAPSTTEVLDDWTAIIPFILVKFLSDKQNERKCVGKSIMNNNPFGDWVHKGVTYVLAFIHP